MDQVHGVVHGPRSMFCIRPFKMAASTVTRRRNDELTLQDNELKGRHDERTNLGEEMVS